MRGQREEAGQQSGLNDDEVTSARRESERLRLKTLVSTMLPPAANGAYIVRTAAQSASAEDLGEDMAYLQKLWQYVRAQGAQMVFELNKVAGANGVGRIDLIEDRVVGLKSREVYECPGSVTLIEAHKALERLVLTRDELRLKAMLDQKYAELIYDAQWSSPLRSALDAFNAKIAERLTGEVRVQLLRGRAVVSGCGEIGW